jgi:ribosomal protein L29
MKIKELRGKNKEELEKILLEKAESVRKQRFDLVAKQVKGVRLIRAEKRDIARVMTLLNEK